MNETIIIMRQLQSSCFKRHVASITNGRPRQISCHACLRFLSLTQTANNCKYIKKFNIRLTSNNDFSPFLLSFTVALLNTSITAKGSAILQPAPFKDNDCEEFRKFLTKKSNRSRLYGVECCVWINYKTIYGNAGVKIVFLAALLRVCAEKCS